MKNFAQTWFYKVCLFLLGFLLLAIPVLIVHRAIATTEKLSYQSRRQEALEHTKSIRALLNTQGMVSTFLEERLDQCSRKIAEAIDGARNGTRDPSAIRGAVADGFRQLESAGLGNISARILFHTLEGSQTHRLDPEPTRGPTFTSDTEGFLTGLLQFLTETLYRKIPATRSRLDTMVSPYLGIPSSMGYLLDEFLGKAVPVVVDKKPYFLFWKPLISQEYFRTLARDREIPFRGEGQQMSFADPARGRFLLGALLLLLPRDTSRTQKARTMVLGFDDPTTSFAIHSASTGETYATSNFPRARLDELAGPGTRVEQIDEVVATDTLELDRTYRLTILSRIPPLAPDELKRHFLIKLSTGIALLLGTITWLLACFCNFGLTNFLAGQLWWGFTLASLLPLATTFFIVELLAEERHETLLKKNRLELLQEMNSVENRFLFHHARIWRGLQHVSRNRSFSRVLEKIRAVKNPSSRQLRQIDLLLRKAFNLAAHRIPGLSIRSIVLAGTRGFSRYFSRDQRGLPIATGTAQPQESLGLADLLGVFGEKSLQALSPERDGPEPSEESEREKPKDMLGRKDFLLEFGTKYIISLFGSEGFFRIVYGFGHNFQVNSGSGNWLLGSFLVPSEKKPYFLMEWLYLSKYTDQLALNRILAANRTRFQVFSFDKSRTGQPPCPEWGEQFPFLRQVARQVVTGGNRVSTRAEYAGEIYQIEGVPILSSNQFILVGVSPESLLSREIQNFRTNRYLPILFAFLVALSLSILASLDILHPLDLLKSGLAAINQGIFSHRLPLLRSDELGQVFHSFNGMARGLEEGELMGKMVSSSAREAIKAGKGDPASVSGERREVTVLFIGIPGFDQILKDAEPEAFFIRLNQQVQGVCQCLVRHRGDIDKIIGDKVLAFFPHDEGGGSRESISQAIGALRDLAIMEKNGELPFPLAAGINRGTVISGFLGTGARRDHTIIGDPVNLAARAQAVAETLSENRFVITGEVLRFLDPSVSHVPLDITSVKGKHQAVFLSQIRF